MTPGAILRAVCSVDMIRYDDGIVALMRDGSGACVSTSGRAPYYANATAQSAKIEDVYVWWWRADR